MRHLKRLRALLWAAFFLALTAGTLAALAGPQG